MSSFSSQSSQALDASSSAGHMNTHPPTFTSEAQNRAFTFSAPMPHHMPHYATPTSYAQSQNELAAPTTTAAFGQQQHNHGSIHPPSLDPFGPSVDNGLLVNLGGLSGIYPVAALPRFALPENTPLITISGGAPDWLFNGGLATGSSSSPPAPFAAQSAPSAARRASVAAPSPVPQPSLPAPSAGPSDRKGKGKRLRSPSPGPVAPAPKKAKGSSKPKVARPYEVIQWRIEPQYTPAANQTPVAAAVNHSNAALPSSDFHFMPPQAPVYPRPATQTPAPRTVPAVQQPPASRPVAEGTASSSSAQDVYAQPAQTPAPRRHDNSQVAAVQQRPTAAAQRPVAHGIPASAAAQNVYPAPTAQRPAPRRLASVQQLAAVPGQVPVAQELMATSSSASPAPAIQTSAPRRRDNSEVPASPAQVPVAQGLAASPSSSSPSTAGPSTEAANSQATLINITNASMPPSPPRAVQRPRIASSSGGPPASSSGNRENRDEPSPIQRQRQRVASAGVPVPVVALDLNVEKAAGPSESGAPAKPASGSGVDGSDAQMPVQKPDHKKGKGKESVSCELSDSDWKEMWDYLNNNGPIAKPN